MAEKHGLEQYSQPHPVQDNVQAGQGEPQWYTPADPKRRKIDQQMAKSDVDPHNAPVSRVVHGRAIPDGCSFQMIVNTLQRFGKIRYVLHLQFKIPIFPVIITNTLLWGCLWKQKRGNSGRWVKSSVDHKLHTLFFVRVVSVNW